MGDKLTVIEMYADPNQGNWGWYVKAMLAFGGRPITTTAVWSSNTYNQFEWPASDLVRLQVLTLIRDALITEAANQGETVNAVAFPDGTVLFAGDTDLPPPVFKTPIIVTGGSLPTIGGAAGGAGTPWQMANPARPGRVTISGYWSGSITLLGKVGGRLELFSDLLATPAQRLDEATAEVSQALGVVIADTKVMPFKLTADIRANAYLRLASVSTGTNGNGGGQWTINQLTEYPA